MVSDSSKSQHRRSRFASKSDFGPWTLDLGLLALILSASFVGCAWLPRSAINRSNSLIEQAQQAREHGDQQQAMQLLTKAAQTAPDNPEVHRNLGRALLQAGARSEGVNHLRYALRRGADDPDAYLELAGVLMEVGRYDECREMVNSALNLVPTHEQAQLMKGRLAELKHNNDEALEVYYRLLANDPGDVEATLRVANVLVQMDRSLQAAPLLRTVVESERIGPPDQARAHWLLGQIYGQERRWDDAEMQLAAAAALRPQLSADECYQVAYASWEAGDRDRAHEFVSKTLALNPDHADALALAAAFRANATAAQTAYSRPPVPTPKSWQTGDSERTRVE